MQLQAPLPQTAECPAGQQTRQLGLPLSTQQDFGPKNPCVVNVFTCPAAAWSSCKKVEPTDKIPMRAKRTMGVLPSPHLDDRDHASPIWS